MPVLPIVVYLKVGLEGIGEDTVVEKFWELDVNTFRYLYVGLPGLDAEPYLRGDNWLGVALSALMKLPKDKAAEYGAEALRRLSEAAPLTEQQRFLLGDCVEAYLPVDPLAVLQFHGIIERNSTEGVRAMNKTRYELALEAGIEKGLEQGMDRGRRLGLLEVLEAQLETKFGSLPADALADLRALPDDDLLALARKIPASGSLIDLGLRPN